MLVLVLSLAAPFGAIAACGDDGASTPSPPLSEGGSDASREARGSDTSAEDAAQSDGATPLVVTGQSVFHSVAAAPDSGAADADAGPDGAPPNRGLEGVSVELSNRAGNCFIGSHPSLAELTIEVLDSTKPVTAGTYPITSPGNDVQRVSAVISSSDAKCQPLSSEVHMAISGTIVLSAVSTVSKGVTTGTYDLRFENGARLTGSIDAPWCTADGPADLGGAGCP